MTAATIWVIGWLFTLPITEGKDNLGFVGALLVLATWPSILGGLVQGYILTGEFRLLDKDELKKITEEQPK